jgi:threonine/homoserine/homoserine lactone efflux protein
LAAGIYGGEMSIYEAIGMVFVIFTSAIASVGILYLAYVGLRTLLNKPEEAREGDVPVEVKEMFKITR